MSSLSDLPDDILGLISFWLNGFDNCSLWMASDSKLKQRLVSNVITDFDIKYTIPGRYLWPGNFLKKLKRLSRLSLVVDEQMYHIPIQNVELFPIPTLKYLKFDFTNTYHVFNQNHSISFNNATGPTTSSSKQYINLNDYYNDLEHLEIITPWLEGHFSKDFLLRLPSNLQILSLPQNRFTLDHRNPTHFLNISIEILPRTLTTIDAQFEYPYNKKPYLDLSKLPPNLTSLTTNVLLDDKTYHMIPQSLKKLFLLRNVYNMAKLSPYLPTGLEILSINIDENPCSLQTFSHLENLEQITLEPLEQVKLDDLITKCPPKLQKFYCSSLALTDIPVPNRLFSNTLTTLELRNLLDITPEFISSLPQTLTDLTLNRQSTNLNFAFFSLLPRNLKSLDTNLNIVENVSLLPESLTSLRLTSQKSCHVSYFDRLPSKLETFEVSQNLPISMMKQLPGSLTYFYLNADKIVDGDILAMLPKGLLRLYLDAPDNITDRDVAALPPCMEILLLSNNTKLTDDGIEMLPRSLMSLDLPRNRNFTDKCVKHLPRNLTSLTLNQATKITSNSCEDLPKYLLMISLPKCKDWDPDVLIASKNELPQYTRNINLGNPEATRTWKVYLQISNDLCW